MPAAGLTLHKLEDFLVLVLGLAVTDQVNLVLQDDDVLQFHDLDGRQVLGGLRLRAGLVTGYRGNKATKNSSKIDNNIKTQKVGS